MQWLRQLDAPWIDPASTLPPQVQRQAEREIRRFWRSRGWQLVFGEVILWLIARIQETPNADLYGVLAVIIGLAYLFGVVRLHITIWLMAVLMLFGLQGIIVNGLGAVTALSYMIPYSIAGMLLAGRARVFIQIMSVMAFWTSLVYEIAVTIPHAEPTSYLLVSYNILIAAYTFQTLRFLNQLAVEINSTYVAEEVRTQSQHFLARVSHELRTPLNSMLGFAKLLRRADYTDTQREYLHQVIDEGEQLNRLVSDLLDSAHLATGKLTLNKGECDLNAICTTVADEHRPALPDGVTLTTELGDLPTLTADAVRLRQAIGNLVSNAVKQTTQGSITIKTRRVGEQVQVAVSDTGAGISEEQQKLIFVPFVQLDSRQAGVGLGLDIALNLVRLHDGDIQVQSKVGVGSTFTVTLPSQ